MPRVNPYQRAFRRPEPLGPGFWKCRLKGNGRKGGGGGRQIESRDNVRGCRLGGDMPILI